jgi:hypothetical protein
MKSLHLVAIVLSMACLSFCDAEENQTASLPVTPIKELQVEGLDFDNLPTESKVGNLSEVVKEKASLADAFVEQIQTHAILHPYAEGLAYVNGQLCHIGHYTKCNIYTVLEGPHYGLQTTTTHHGIVLYINYQYEIEYTPVGLVLHHFYDDSEVVTGSNQVIVFY